jgi:REP element-mobilizing transposase RayT
MCPYFRNKYLIGSKRKTGSDYAKPGKYFITICTKNKIPYFGKIENGNIVLSEIGVILRNEWLKTPSVRPDMNITLDEFVIMPDHFHAIIIIGKNQYNQNHGDHCKNAMHGVFNAKSQNKFHNTFSPQIKNVASIIRGVKSAVTTSAKKLNMDFTWQPRFYDHIIPDNVALERIRNYIRANPEKWEINT